MVLAQTLCSAARFVPTQQKLVAERDVLSFCTWTGSILVCPFPRGMVPMVPVAIC